MLDPNTLSHADWRARASSLIPVTGHVIDGIRDEAARGGRFEKINPATGEILVAHARGQAADVDRAVAAARRAFPAWARTDPRARAAILLRFADLIEAHAAELALMDCLEAGKPIRDLLAYDIPETAKTLRFYAEACDKIEGTTTAAPHDVLHFTVRQPLGVVGCISPWNYPLLMACWKYAPALAAGNTVVLKPAEEAPMSCLRAAELFVESGGPPGVFNVISGLGEEAGRPLALHPDVAKISFTGSTAVAKLILQYAGQSNLKRVGIEAGGKSPQILCADLPDLDRAAAAAAEGIFGNMGEVCNAGSRILVERGLAGEFVAAFTAKARSWQPGDPLDPSCAMGPLIDAGAKSRVGRFVTEAREAGARHLFGGDLLDRPGHYVTAGAFADVHPDSRLAREEVFGPLAAILTFDHFDEAIALANDSEYGLAAGVWTSDLSKALAGVRDLEAGTIWVNTFNDGDMTQPFGGWKQSGNARDKCLATLLEYTQEKSAWIRL